MVLARPVARVGAAGSAPAGDRGGEEFGVDGNISELRRRQVLLCENRIDLQSAGDVVNAASIAVPECVAKAARTLD
jgi:hypothetical protein